MVPMIVRIFVEGEPGCEDVTEVPVTPATTCRDVIECVRDPGDEICTLVETWAPKCERILQDDERPLEILQEWGQQQDKVKLILRYSIPRLIKANSKPVKMNVYKIAAVCLVVVVALLGGASAEEDHQGWEAKN